MTSRSAPTLIASLLLAGCALPRQPSSGAPRTGEPLSVHLYARTHQQTQTERVGDVTLQDSRGRTIAEGDLYAQRQYTTSSQHWRPKQGETVISDEDLFRLAGDRDKAEHARAYRVRGQRWFGLGVALATLGLGLTVGLIPRYSRTQRPGLGAALVLGSLVGTGGAVLSAFGYRRMSVDGHAFSAAQAQEAADAYNRSLLDEPKLEVSRVRGVSLSGRF